MSAFPQRHIPQLNNNNYGRETLLMFSFSCYAEHDRTRNSQSVETCEPNLGLGVVYVRHYDDRRILMQFRLHNGISMVD